MNPLTKPQQRLLDHLDVMTSYGSRCAVYGTNLRMAVTLQARGVVVLKTHGTAYVTQGWYRYIERVGPVIKKSGKL